MTREAILKRFPRASAAFLAANLDFQAGDSGPVAKLERDSGDAPLEKKKVQGPDRRRFYFRISTRRKRLIDESNLCYKYHEDLCRYVGALPGDSPEICHSEVFQTKCAKGQSEEITIEIFQL